MHRANRVVNQTYQARLIYIEAISYFLKTTISRIQIIPHVTPPADYAFFFLV